MVSDPIVFNIEEANIFLSVNKIKYYKLSRFTAKCIRD